MSVRKYMEPDEIPLYQWKSEGIIHFGCVYKGIRYWRCCGTGDIYDMWDVCEIWQCSDWVRTKPQISQLSYLVITGEHFDIKKVIKEANRNEKR
jgi:hypothetical protein